MNSSSANFGYYLNVLSKCCNIAMTFWTTESRNVTRMVIQQKYKSHSQLQGDIEFCDSNDVICVFCVLLTNFDCMKYCIHMYRVEMMPQWIDSNGL